MHKNNPSQRFDAKFLRIPLAIAISGMGFTVGVHAQEVQPGNAAGLILNTIQEAPKPEFSKPKAPEIDVTKQSRPAMSGASSATVTVKAITLSGNTAVPTADLQEATAGLVGRQVSLNDLRTAADKISDLYRAKGYMVARAYIPAQQIKDGVVEIQIIEGRRDGLSVKSSGDPIVNQSYQQSVVDAALPKGKILTEADLERGLLLLGDLPGVTDVKATLDPGSEVGTSNVNVQTAPANRFFGSVDVDDFGYKYSGQWRTGVTAGVNSMTGYGDQLTFRGQTSWGQDTARNNYGRIAYQIPIGDDGLKLGAAYANMYYRLGYNYSGTNTNGTAGTWSFFGTYPFYRSRDFSLYGQMGYDNLKMINNSMGFEISSKTLNNGSVGLQGNSRDVFLGGGINTFGVNMTYGDLYLANSNGYATTDSLTANTGGAFQRYNININRLQRITDSTQGLINFYGQLSNKNLDSSQQFILGGPSGVRAYPTGEGAGSQGGVAQFEVNQNFWYGTPVGTISGMAFWDAGYVQLYKNTWNNWNQPNPNTGNSLQNSYWLNGFGLGAKATINNRSYISASWARAVGSNPSQTAYGNNVNGTSNKNQFWLQGVYQF